MSNHKSARRLKEVAKRRKAREIDEGRQLLVQQGSDKGFNVEMIRDFLEYLLLELRCNQSEALSALRELEVSGELKSCKGDEISSSHARPKDDVIVEQYTQFHKQYETALLPKIEIDPTGATEEEANAVAKAVLMGMNSRRDEQIGHLEALQDLFDEALMCAKLPYGMDPAGEEICATQTVSVREEIDTWRRTKPK